MTGGKSREMARWPASHPSREGEISGDHVHLKRGHSEQSPKATNDGSSLQGRLSPLRYWARERETRVLLKQLMSDVNMPMQRWVSFRALRACGFVTLLTLLLQS